MKKYNFKKIDAFATSNSEGNPAGYIKLEQDENISNGEMLQIARELKGFVNEVGFLSQTEIDYEFILKFYSSEREVDFCGHATIAIMYDLFKTETNLQNKARINIRTNRGILTVENRLKEEDAVFIMAPLPFMVDALIEKDVLAENMNISIDDLDDSFSISIINAGLTTLIVPIKSLDSILNIKPDLETLNNFCKENNIDIIEVFSTETSNNSSDYRVRVFAPTFGYLEDPATGSGNSAFGYYLINRNLFLKDTLNIEQNNNRNKFNRIKLQKTVDEEGNNRILFGGGAINRIEGCYILH